VEPFQVPHIGRNPLGQGRPASGLVHEDTDCNRRQLFDGALLECDAHPSRDCYVFYLLVNDPDGFADEDAFRIDFVDRAFG
jgi:hypothetical protein